MTHSDNVRQYCKNELIEKAKSNGVTQVVIRAGDIHKIMGYKNRLPLVCAALGAKIFEEMANVERISITGPTNGSNTIFTFKIK